MQKHDLSFSPDELAALRDMSDKTNSEAAKNDLDAREMSDDMLADAQPGRRVRRGKDARSAAAKHLQDEARASDRATAP